MTAVFSFRCVKLPIMALKISILISLMPKCILWGPIDTSLGLCPMWDIRPKIIKLKSRDILFVYNIRFNNPIVLKFCTEHGSYTVVLCTKFQDDWIIETDVMDKRDFARSEFKMIFGRIYYIAHNPSYTLWFNSDLVYRAGEKLKPQPNITAVRDAWQQHTLYTGEQCVNTLRARQNWRYFADDIFKCILLHENAWIQNRISLKFVPKGPINNILWLVQIMAWRRRGDKLLSEPMMVSSLTHICVTRPQWVNSSRPSGGAYVSK